MNRRKKKLFAMSLWPLLAVLIAVGPAAERDPNLVGNWRGVKPVGPDDPAEVFELRFEKKGEAVMYRVQYQWNAEAQAWEPATADQPAQGDDDKWETENGYLSIMIRERYATNRDLVCRYRIAGDTLFLHMAEIFRPVGEPGNTIYGEWKMETYDQSYPDEKRSRQISIEEPGILKEKANGKIFQGKIFPVEGGWKQLAQMNSNDPSATPDTLFQPCEVIGGNLYLYQPYPWTKLIKRK